MAADLVIKGGTVVDGTGAPGVRADVAISGDRIVEVGEGLSGTRVLEADGHVVAPGFIDIHTHYDAQVFWDPALTPSSWHGVTSVVAGNCGFTIAPCRPEHRELIGKTLQHVEDMNLATLQAGIPWDFETFPEYLDSVARHGHALNYGAYIGHTAVRLFVMGDAGYEREATDDELAAMAAVVRDGLLAGAVGFASTSAPTHNGEGGRPVPSRLADIREMEALVTPLKELGRGVGAFTPGERVVHPEIYDLQTRIGRPFTWTALLTRRGTTFAQDMAAYTAQRRAEGVDVWPQVTVRPLTFQMNLKDPFTFNVNPSFRALMDRPVEERIAAYSDPAWRARALEEMNASMFAAPRWGSMRIAESRDPALVGRTIADVAEERGGDPLDVMMDIALAEDLEPRFSSVLANDDDSFIGQLVNQEGMLMGLSDAGAHVGQLCDACLPTDLLGNWARDRDAIRLEKAVHKLTGEPAGVYGFAGRGVIAEGAFADVCVFDPDTVAPGPVRRVTDFPADGERLVADRPEGVRHVLVNGTVIRADGTPDDEALATRPGALLRS